VSRRLATALVVVLAAASARAFARPEGPPVRSERHAGGEEAFEMVDAYIVGHLQKSLGLDDEQFAEVLPLVQKLHADRRDFYLSRARALRRLRLLLGSGTATEAEVLAQLRQLEALEEQGPAKVHRSLETLDAALTPMQQAKYRVLEFEVEHRLRRLIERARSPRARCP
jgi:Spy/CpxP family protein refolding chaperone